MKRRKRRINMNRKYLFLILTFFLLAGCSATPGETDDSSESSLSSHSPSSEQIESISSEISSLESEESSLVRTSQKKQNLSSIWISEKARDVFKQTYENPKNNIQEELVLENADLSDWELSNISNIGNNQAMFFRVNPDNSEKYDWIEILRGGGDERGYTEINLFQGERDEKGETIYPLTPVKSYIVRESDFTVVDSSIPLAYALSVFITQEGGEIDSSVPRSYGIFPEANQVSVYWGDVSKSYDTDLLTFTFNDESIEMSYQDKEKESHTKTFTILSDSVVQDETGKEYQWFKGQEF